MASATLLDIAKLNGNDTAVGLIEENLTYAPEISVFPARQIRGTSYKLVLRDSYPGVGFRTANDGVDATKSTFSNKLIECFILSAKIQADVAVASAYEGGAEAWKDVETMGAAKQALIELGSQIFYGTSVDDKGFPGLQETHTALATSLVVDAGGTTAGTGSSVYGVKFGLDGVQLITGNNTTFSLGEWRIESVAGSTGTFDAHVATLNAWVGLQVGSKYSVGRLKDATEDSGKGVSDAKLADLLRKYPVGYKPDYWFMSRRSAYQLQTSRSATTVYTGPKTGTGSEVWAPMPTESNGIPIIVTDSLIDTETLS